MSSISYTPPAEIDRDTPQEVRVVALDQLLMIVDEVETLVDDTIKQVRNAGQQDALEAGSTVDHQGIYEVRRPREAALLKPMADAAYRLKLLVKHVKATSQEYDADPDAGVL